MSLYTYLKISLGVPGVILLLLASFVLIKFFLIPLWSMSYYKKLGFRSYFYPFIGTVKRGRQYEQKYGDSMSYYRMLAKEDPSLRAEVVIFGTKPGLILYDPKLIKEFYGKQSLYKKQAAVQGVFKLLGTGLVTADGGLWKNHRKVLSNVFHFEFLKEKIPTIVDTVREFLVKLKESPKKDVIMINEIQKITGEVVGRIFFGNSLNQYTLHGQPLTLYLAGLMVRLTISLRNPVVIGLILAGLNPEWVSKHRKVMDEVREFREVCFKLVQDRKASKVKTHDMLGLLLETQNLANPEDRFTDEDIINEYVTFFFAGMDTTGHLTTMALYFLAKEPKYREAIQKEVEEIYNKSNPVSIEGLNQMEMLHSTLKETLRMYGPAPIINSRVAQVEHELLDIKIKKGMSVRPTPTYNCFNSKYFEEPEKFMPERWLNKKEKEVDPFVYIPFSAGPRNCIGQHLSILESKIIISEFLKTFNFSVPEDFKLMMTFSPLYVPKNKIVMNLDSK